MRRLFYVEHDLLVRPRCTETFTYNKRQSWRINIARRPFTMEHYRSRRTKSSFDGYSRGIGLLEFTYIIAFLRRVSNFRRHMQDAVSLLCIRSLYIRKILHDHSSLLHSFNRVTCKDICPYLAIFLSFSQP